MEIRSGIVVLCYGFLDFSIWYCFGLVEVWIDLKRYVILIWIFYSCKNFKFWIWIDCWWILMEELL